LLVVYFMKNYLSKKNMSLSNDNVGLNFDVFLKVIGASCVSSQIRDVIFGLNPNTQNIFVERNDIRFDKEHLF